MAEPSVCTRCKHNILLYESEIDVGICGDCADVLIEQDMARREWAEFHPVDPSESMPSSENVPDVAGEGG